MPSICHLSKGERVDDFNHMILPKRSASIKVQTMASLARSIKCCLVYELIDQRNESKPIIEYHQVFVAVRVFVRPLIKKYKASAVMFMARSGQFTGIPQIVVNVFIEHRAWRVRYTQQYTLCYKDLIATSVLT
jgi:DNA helicase IV